MRELSEQEQIELATVARQLEVISGVPGAYDRLLDAIERMTTEASRIPAEYFEPTERAGSKPFELRFRRT